VIKEEVKEEQEMELPPSIMGMSSVPSSKIEEEPPVVAV
jgi:hypothetical protein